jgi:RluA family pseudouridine synthase
MRKLSSKPSKESTVLDYLTNRFTYFNREDWKKLILKRQVELDGEIVALDTVSKPGQTIDFYVEDHLAEEPEVNHNWSLLWEDEYLFIVDKPSNIPVHPAGRYRENSLLRLLETQYNDIDFFPCHRLDRETSGVLIFAKDPLTSRRISEQFQKKSIIKEYRVWVYGNFPKELCLSGEIVKDDTSLIRKKKKLIKTIENKIPSAITKFCLVRSNGVISEVQAFPITGKIHQIRASLYTAGYPVVGDKIYGRDETAFLEFIESGWSEKLQNTLGHNRQALHCNSIELFHPSFQKNIQIISAIPSELTSLL